MSVTLLPAVEQLRLLEQRKISAAELAEEHIRQIERFNPRLNALIEFEPDLVRAEARAPKSGPLAGLPITVKSSIEVMGYKCEIGSVLNRGHVAHEDAEAVARLRQAGATVLGTTNCPEFLMAYETDNVLYGRTNNPWNLEHSAGGSSGGEAAAIAAGLSACGLGSDSGGSVREPAHFCGIASLKPTPGRVPGRGHRPSSVGPFSILGAVGPMARTIADVALLFRILCAQDPLDPESAPIRFRDIPANEVKPIPIGWFDDDGLTPVTQETRQAVRDAVGALQRQGFNVQHFRPVALEEARRLWSIFFVQCGEMFYREVINGREHELSPVFRGFLELARAEQPLTADSLLGAWAECDMVRHRLLAEMQQVPILLCPVSAAPAFRHGEREWMIEGQVVRYLDAMRYTQWFNLFAAPAAVVPVGRSADGLPIGVQIAGRPYEDEAVLAVAAAVEREFGYQTPTICR
ncbi:MAG: amidase [Silvibacterium sp.]|nr:amidase [Silvibacterium sp.]MBV8437705.1 amidase [Silvibacterium sp.]